MQKSKILSWVGVISWMAVIFLFSNQPATDSSKLSSGITEFILIFVEKISSEASAHMDTLHHIVRKNAHFIIYLILGVLTINAMKKSGVRHYRSVIFSLVICVLYAISDELHQMLIPGRSGEAKDVLIDSSGAAVGIGIYLLAEKLIAVKKYGKSWSEALSRH